MNTEKEKFEPLWDDFITLVKGKLITSAKKQTLSTSLANLILTDAASSWGSDYEINGRWMKKFIDESPSKANLVKEILLQDMKFTNITMMRVLPDYCNYLIPTIGAFVGYATGSCFSVGKIIQVVSTVAPAILLFPVVKMYRENQYNANAENAVTQYISQLTKYKDSIISILS